jgi:folate-dependent phosphoribosylglycinamide formyltransferase PurN
MKVVALTSKDPGIRHCAHLWALQDIGVEVVSVELSGLGILKEKVLRQAQLLTKKGVLPYLRWRLDRHCADDTRREVAEVLTRSLAGAPFASFKPKIAGCFGGFSSSLVNFIAAERPDFVFQLGVGLVPAHFIRRVPPILNLHPGILPGIRGLDPIFWAHYYAREDWFGTTLHVIDDGIDTGPPLLRRRFAPRKNVHCGESIRDQVLMEIELLRVFFAHYPHDHTQFDSGGCEKSLYRSTWTKDQFARLKAANWWGPVEQKPRGSADSLELPQTLATQAR